MTSFFVKEGTAGTIQKTLESKYGIVVARGIYEARDKMIRIGHFGILTPERLGEALDSLESILMEVGAVGRQVQVAKRRK